MAEIKGDFAGTRRAGPQPAEQQDPLAEPLRTQPASLNRTAQPVQAAQQTLHRRPALLRARYGAEGRRGIKRQTRTLPLRLGNKPAKPHQTSLRPGPSRGDHRPMTRKLAQIQITRPCPANPLAHTGSAHPMAPRHLGQRLTLDHLCKCPKHIAHTIDLARQHIARQNPLPTATSLAYGQPDRHLAVTVTSRLKPA